MPLLSIIIPTFNSSATLRRALDSILNQSYANFEIWLIDGISKDNTVGIIREYQLTDARVKFVSEPDKGIYDAMNKGIEKVQGEWIYFMGADDYLYDQHVLEKVQTVLCNTSSDFVYGSVKINGEGTWAADGQIYDGMFSLEKLFKTNISHQAIFYRKTIFARLGNFNIDYNVCADWDFNHRCFATIKPEYVDIIVANFQAGGQSTVSQSDKYFSEDCIINLKKYHAISYFNPFFKRYDWIFFIHAGKEFSKLNFIKATRFMVLSFYHSSTKFSLFKGYIKRVLHSFIKKPAV